MKQATKKKSWLQPRHKVVTEILRYILGPYCRLRYGITVEKFSQQEERPYLILLNHQTPFDQFFVGLAFRGPVYYMATEDIFSLGWVSTLIRWLIAPIPIRKQTTDVQAVMNCMRIAREGGTIAIAPEGNRTYSGRTEYMNPAIAPLVKKLKVPVVLFRIEGGYGVEPRWSSVIRRGKMRAFAGSVIQPEEYGQMTNDELMERIREGLFVEENQVSGTFRHKQAAEYLERMVYVCPDCGLSTFYSQGDLVSCQKCRRQIRYLPTKELEGVERPFPFRFAGQWYDYQKEFVNGLDVLAYREEAMYRERARLSEVLLYKRKQVLRKDAEFALYGDRLVIDEGKEEALVLAYSEVSAMAVLGRNKLNIYTKDMVYQVKGSKRFNALKYVHLYFRYKNISRGEENGKFLGL